MASYTDVPESESPHLICPTVLSSEKRNSAPLEINFLGANKQKASPMLPPECPMAPQGGFPHAEKLSHMLVSGLHLTGIPQLSPWHVRDGPSQGLGK